jgi:hypothetical protein
LRGQRFVQRGALLVQRLGAFSVVPDVGILELAGDFFQLFLLAIVVKDTS